MTDELARAARTPAEPLADGEMIENLLELICESYKRGHDEGAEDVFIQHEACGEHQRPHKDFRSEGAAQLRDDFEPKLRAILAAYNPNDRLREALEASRRALQRMMDTWLDYHDAHSLTEPVTGASANAFDDALAARDMIDAALSHKD